MSKSEVEKFTEVLQSRDLWFSFDTGEIITDAVLRQRIAAGSYIDPNESGVSADEKE